MKKALNLLFESEERKSIAHWLLCEIRDKERTDKPYLDSDGRTFCRKRNYSYTTYAQVLSLLKKYGSVKKIGHELYLSDSFVEELESEWRKFLINKLHFYSA